MAQKRVKVISNLKRKEVKIMTKKQAFYAGYKSKKGLTKKVCNICQKDLSIKNFWKDKYLLDGYCGYCKDCYKKRWVLKDPAYASKNKYQTMSR